MHSQKRRVPAPLRVTACPSVTLQRDAGNSPALQASRPPSSPVSLLSGPVSLLSGPVSTSEALQASRSPRRP